MTTTPRFDPTGSGPNPRLVKSRYLALSPVQLTAKISGLEQELRRMEADNRQLKELLGH